MERGLPPRSGHLGSQVRPTNCTCAFCLLVFSMKDPTEADLLKFRLHLQRIHGLKVGEPEA